MKLEMKKENEVENLRNINENNIEDNKNEGFVVIKNIIDYIKGSKLNTSIYYVLLIITDGSIYDVDEKDENGNENTDYDYDKIYDKLSSFAKLKKGSAGAPVGHKIFNCPFSFPHPVKVNNGINEINRISFFIYYHFNDNML